MGKVDIYLHVYGEGKEIKMEEFKSPGDVGFWLPMGMDYYFCSNCGYYASAKWLSKWTTDLTGREQSFPVHCPFCGEKKGTPRSAKETSKEGNGK